MARPLQPFEETIGNEIYQALLAFVDQYQMIPNPHAFWSKVLVAQQGYALSRGGFDYWFFRLQLAGLVRVDPITKAIRVKDIRIEVNSP